MYGVIVKVYDLNRFIIEVLRWDSLPFKLRMKYNWYFEYRAALLKVKYPKYEVRLVSFDEKASGKIVLSENENLVISKKRTLSKYFNKLKAFEKDYVSLFPINEDPEYLKALAKVQRLEQELKDLINS